MGLLLVLAIAVCCVMAIAIVITLGAALGYVLGEAVILGLFVWGIVSAVKAIRGRSDAGVPRMEGRAHKRPLFEPEKPPVEEEEKRDTGRSGRRRGERKVSEERHQERQQERVSYPKMYEYLDVDGNTSASDIEQIGRAHV